MRCTNGKRVYTCKEDAKISAKHLMVAGASSKKNGTRVLKVYRCPVAHPNLPPHFHLAHPKPRAGKEWSPRCK